MNSVHFSIDTNVGVLLCLVRRERATRWVMQDKELLDILQKDKVNTWYMGSKGMDQNSVKADFGWGSPKFHKMGRCFLRLQCVTAQEMLSRFAAWHVCC